MKSPLPLPLSIRNKGSPGRGTRTVGLEEAKFWQQLRDFEWAKGDILIKIPVTPRALSELDFAFGRIDARRHYSAAGNVAHAALSARQFTAISRGIEELGLQGLVLRGKVDELRPGRHPSTAAEQIVKQAMDPDGTFPPLV